MRHSPQTCSVCATIQANPEKPNTVIATLANTTESSVRRHKTPLTDPLANKDGFFTEIPEAIITSRGKSIRTPDGWEKITYRPQDLAMLEAVKYDDIERAIEKFVPGPTPEREVGGTEVLCLSDLQLGKVASGGGTKETVKRVLQGIDNFDKSLRTLPAELVLWDLGDILENFDNVGSQRGTNDLDLTMQIRTARRLLLEVLLRVSRLSSKVTLASVPSNHCQVRLPGGKDLASTPNNDWGIELSHQIEDVLTGRPEFQHVSFLRTEGHAEAITYETMDGTVIGGFHGHQAGSQNKVGDWWKGQSHGRRNNLHNADVLLYGHFHNLAVSQSGDARWAIGTTSSDGGSDWFTNKTGESSIAGLTAFSIADGMWSNLRIC